MIALAVLIVFGFSSLHVGLWWLEKQRQASAVRLLESFTDQAREDRGKLNELLIRGENVSTRLEELHASLQPLRDVRATLFRQADTIKLIPDALKGVVDKVETAFQKLEEKALPEEAHQIAPVIMSRIERHRMAMERASEDSLKALNERISQGGKEQPIRIRGDE